MFNEDMHLSSNRRHDGKTITCVGLSASLLLHIRTGERSPFSESTYESVIHVSVLGKVHTQDHRVQSLREDAV